MARPNAINMFESHGGAHVRYRTTLSAKNHVIVERFENDVVISIRLFKVGDYVEYDSYNLSYYGPITSISDKIITVQSPCQKKRMKPETFAWRNWNFNVDVVRRKNSEITAYL